MRKITLLLTTMLFVTSLSWAQTWCGNSYMTVNSTWYTGSNSYMQAAGKFDGATLPEMTTDFTLGGELQVYPDMATAATMYYNIDGGSFTAISLPKTGTEGNNSKHYGEGTVSIAALSKTSHTIEIYFQAGTVYDSNATLNFKATFTKSSTTQNSQIGVSPTIYSVNGTIYFSNVPLNKKIQVYDVTGKLLHELVAVNAVNSLNTTKKGIVLVKIGTQISKVVL